MNSNYIFNATVCIFGILMLGIHIISIILKKKKRKDEKCLLDFFVFTIFHFSVYLAFTIIRMSYTSNGFIIAFYTSFYIMNNIELLLLFRYMKNYTELPNRIGKTLNIINLSSFTIFCLLDIINIFTGIFFTAENGVYLRSNTMIISQGYQFIMFTAIFVTAVASKKLNPREKIAFALYCVLPFIAIILQNAFKGYAIAYASIIVAIEVLFVFIGVEKNFQISMQKEKIKDAQINIMLSQIQPHFVYNSLSAISTLITIDPEKAQEALDNFTEYLRRNLSSLTDVKLIPFEDELKHIETYISLEKLRFDDRINVIYDLKTTDFLVPVLSVQPIVENAIKHGILKKVEGGTLKISTYEAEDSYVIVIEDNGVGFNNDDVKKEENHYGIDNIEYRIKNMCNGSLDIKSVINKGTIATITLKK
jgi:two-component sensor histidine kinase